MKFLDNLITNSSTIFLKLFILAVGLVALVLMLWEPHVEGRNEDATLYQIYFNDPFLIFAYLGSIPFFVALYQAYKIIKCIEKENFFNQMTIKLLRTIKNCALIIIGFVLASELYILSMNNEDKAGGVFIGFTIIILSLLTVASTEILEKILKQGKRKIIK